MKCREVKRLLSLEMEGYALPHELKFVEEHLKSCPGCARERKELLAYKKLMKENFLDAEIPPLTPYFGERFWQRVREEEEKEKAKVFHPKVFRPFPTFPTFPRRAYLQLATVAVVAVFTLTFTFFMGRKGTFEMSPPLPSVVTEEQAGRGVQNINVLVTMATAKVEREALNTLADREAKEILRVIL